MASVLQGRQTKADLKEQERKKRQDELGVCRIRRSEDDHRSQTLGCGFVVRDLVKDHPLFSCPHCLITSDKVFLTDDWNDSKIKRYHLDYRKFESNNLKTIKLEDVADRSKDIYHTSGLVVIPIVKPSKKGDQRKKSIFTYRSFKVANEGANPDDEDLHCYYVDENAESFAVKRLKLKIVSGQYELHEPHETYKTYDQVTRRGDRKPYGAVILKRSNGEFMVAGALTFTNDPEKNISPVFFPLALAMGSSEGQPAPDDSVQQLPANEENPVEVESSEETTSSISENLPITIDAASATNRNNPQTQSNSEAAIRVREVLQEMGSTAPERLQLHLKGALKALIDILSEGYHALVQSVLPSSLKITIQFRTLEHLEYLWRDYQSGTLNQLAEKCLMTDEIKSKLEVEEVSLKTQIRKEDYLACKRSLRETPVAGSQRRRIKTRRKSAAKETEVLQIPKEMMGHVIGRKGWRINDIRKRSGVQTIFVKGDQVHLRGTEEQLASAKTIIDMILKLFQTQEAKEDIPGDQRFWKKLDFIPVKYMGIVIGRNRIHLNNIEQKTGAVLKVFQRNTLLVKGSIESQKKAIRYIKEYVGGLMRQSHAAGQRPLWCVYVDTDQLDPDQEFRLMPIVQPLDAFNLYETERYKLQPEQSLQDMKEASLPPGYTGIDRLQDKLLEVLTRIHREKEEERVIIDMWCHLGHAYITEVDEDDVKEEYFTLAEIKEKLEEEKSWTSFFKGGLEKIEVECIEKYLESRTAKEEIRYDFAFYTPSCRYVRVKVWLRKEDVGQNGDQAASMSRAPCLVMTVLSHVLPDEQEDSSHEPCFYMCSQTQRSLKADIFMLSKGCDYRLFIKTCPDGLVPRTPEEEEEDKVLESYLMGMKIDGDKLVLPPDSECPDGFDLFYQRRSLRRIYEYEMDGEQFTLLISKYQGKTVDPIETDVSGFDDIAVETDIHLHCKEWDRLLEEGNWEPKQIVAKLPTFFQFLRHVQRAVTPQVEGSED